MEPVIEKLNNEYTEIFSFCGLDWLHAVREKFDEFDLPVILYTSKGHLLLHQKEKQDWLSKASDLKAYWLPKGTATYEAERKTFIRVLDNRAKNRPTFKELLKDRRFIASQIIGAIVSLVLGILIGIVGL